MNGPTWALSGTDAASLAVIIFEIVDRRAPVCFGHRVVRTKSIAVVALKAVPAG